MEELSISYFRDLLSKNITSLQSFCNEWEEIYKDSSVPDEAKDEIRTTIGLTNLLMAQKLKQFQGLIDDSEFKRGEKEITCLDLQGFWDMVYNEVEKISRSFQKLIKCKESNWTFVQDQEYKPENKKKTFPAVTKVIVSTKNHASAARQRLAEAKRRMKEQMALKEEKILDERTVDKIPMSNVTNLSTSVEQQTVSTFTKKGNPYSRVIESQEKENLSCDSPLENEPSGREGRNKEFVPLQCITRSKKAMMAQQNM